MAGQAFDQGGNGSSKPKLMAEINITPMVDVMLVLLVIFMVTAPLLVAGVKVELPRNAAPKLAHLQKPIIVTLTADGSLYIGEGRAGSDGLRAQLAARRANHQRPRTRNEVFGTGLSPISNRSLPQPKRKLENGGQRQPLQNRQRAG